MTSSRSIEGGCAFGAVRLSIIGKPIRAGLCHCMTCRKVHAAAFNPFVVYARHQVRVSGELARWQSSPGYERQFCPTCGSRVIGCTIGSDEVEVSLGTFDAPAWVRPQYESWVKRREPWQMALSVPQYDSDRPKKDPT